MSALEKKIFSLIENRGPLPFEAFMEIALYDPVHGYYHSGRSRIGKKGDFFTSSHLHAAFGAMIGRQIAEMWEVMGRPEDFRIVELAPGEGFLSRDLLDSLKGRTFFTGLEYWLVERSPGQRERQQEILSEHQAKVRWYSSIEEVPSLRGCVVSNELLDAFPVHLVRMERELRELYVSVSESGLVLRPGPVSTPLLHDYLEEFSLVLEEGYETEINLRIRDWVKNASACIREGFLLTIDYGYTAREYYTEDRNRGTLLCYHGHTLNENPLGDVGEQDITAHVNFSSLKKWGEGAGLRTLGYSSQGSFLVSLGILDAIENITPGKSSAFDIARIKKLILPQGLGESHMVMVQYKGSGDPVLKGFSLRNRLRFL